MATKAKMTIERAKMILGWVQDWQKLEPSRRAAVEVYVGLKLSCGRLAAARIILKAREVWGFAAWDQALGVGQVPAKPADPVRPDPPKTPLIDRLNLIERENQDMVTFVKWLEATGRLTNPGGWAHEEIVAAYRGIDLAAVLAERKAVLQYAADMQDYWRRKDAADAAVAR